jgi:hypothetical protein
MRKILQWMLVIGLAFAPVLSSAPAEATTLPHTWVASNGSDGNNCDRSAPCLSFGGAYNNTDVGGEITCVDSGSFAGQSFTIAHALTINCENVLSSNLATNGVSQIFIQTSTTDVVVLRGLDMDGENGGCGEIVFTGAGTLHLQKMKMNAGTFNGCSSIKFIPNGPAKLFVSDSDITNNGGSIASGGVYVWPQSGVEADFVIDRTHIEGNYFGIIADGTQGGIIHGVIRDSVVSGNTENGITASTTSSDVILFVDNTAVSENFHGLVAGGSAAAIMVSNTGVSGNTAAGLFTVNGGQLFSYGNNRVDGNNRNNGAFTGMATLK